MKYFTNYWRNPNWDYQSELDGNGEQQRHTAGNAFRSHGVVPGDAIYVVTVKEGRLFVAGKMIVGEITDQEEAARILGDDDLWEADEHIIASASTPFNWDREVPLEITEQLRCVSTRFVNGMPLNFVSPGRLDVQTLRGIRQLTPESATLLDEHLGEMQPIDVEIGENDSLWRTPSFSDEFIQREYESFADGRKKEKFVTFYERDPRNRDEAIRIHGYDCVGCGVNFEKKYGPQGQGFIHVHHLKPVSEYERPEYVNPTTDMTVLCPNCHAMVHRNKTHTLSIRELKSIIRANERQLVF